MHEGRPPPLEDVPAGAQGAAATGHCLGGREAWRRWGVHQLQAGRRQKRNRLVPRQVPALLHAQPREEDPHLDLQGGVVKVRVHPQAAPLLPRVRDEAGGVAGGRCGDAAVAVVVPRAAAATAASNAP